MRVGTPGFDGARLRQAREARQVSGVALAAMLGVTRASISNYEKGWQSPSPEILTRLSQVLNLKPSFFTTPMPSEQGGSALFWRSLAAATASARRSGEVRLEWLLEIVGYLRRFVSLPTVNFPPSLVSSELTELPGEDIERIAEDARRYWGLGDGPISDVTLLAENNGAVIARCDLGSDALDAFSRWYWSSGVPFVFLGTGRSASARDRFNLAHELGHLLLHRYLPQKGIGRLERHKEVEAQAHRFAGAFLLPAGRFQDELFSLSLDAFLVLKADWNVSVGAMIQRVADLGIATDDQVRRLWINYNRRGWRRKEPLDDETPPEDPRVLRRAVEMLVNAGVRTRAQIAGSFSISTNDFEELVGLPHGYLEGQQPELYLLGSEASRRRTSAARSISPGQSASVIQFPGSRSQG